MKKRLELKSIPKLDALGEGYIKKKSICNM